MNVLTASFFATLALSTAACSADAGSPPADLPSVSDGICAAIDAPDISDAETIFDDRVHQLTHDLVADLEDEHRAVAGKILVAKNQVESDLSEEVQFSELKEDLKVLYGAVQEGLVALELEVAECVVE